MFYPTIEKGSLVNLYFFAETHFVIYTNLNVSVFFFSLGTQFYWFSSPITSQLKTFPSCRFLAYMVTALKDHVFGGSLLDFVDRNS